MADMNAIRPVPMPVLLLISGFAGLVGWGRYYGWTSGSAPSSRKAKRLTFGILLGGIDIYTLRLDKNLVCWVQALSKFRRGVIKI